MEYMRYINYSTWNVVCLAAICHAFSINFQWEWDCGFIVFKNYKL